LVKILENTNKKDTIKHGTWALSNLCRGKPLPPFNKVKDAIPTLCRVVGEEIDSEVLTDACWALSYLSDGDVDFSAMIFRKIESIWC
jgi:importin subunit alpha-1